MRGLETPKEDDAHVGPGAITPWRPITSRLLRQLLTILLYRDFDPMIMEPSAEALLALISADSVRQPRVVCLGLHMQARPRMLTCDWARRAAGVREGGGARL